MHATETSAQWTLQRALLLGQGRCGSGYLGIGLVLAGGEHHHVVDAGPTGRRHLQEHRRQVRGKPKPEQ